MALPEPARGLIINYSYLWFEEAQKGKVEGRKDRPCGIVIATSDKNAVVVPITHSKPQPNSQAVEIPPRLSKQLGLDDQISWIVTSEYNIFNWPGFDLRPRKQSNNSSYVYGTLPRHILLQVTKLVAENIRSKKIQSVNREI